MRVYLVVCATLLLGVPAIGQKAKKPVEWPTQFEIGVFTFFDFGPPFDYYSLYIVRPAESGTYVERLLLTPPGDKCFAPAKIEKATAKLKETVDQLFGPKNPCEIPEKELKRELKRCKHCLTFSGSNVKIQVSCGGVTRLLRSDILDHDMFNPAVKTPENTSWTMGLLSKLDRAAGPGAMDKPMFPRMEEKGATTMPVNEDESKMYKELEAGRFDTLFPSDSLKLSALYLQTQAASIAHPTVTITEIKPRTPENLVAPQYPRLALATRSEGQVTATFNILDDGTPSVPPMLSGHPLLQASVVDAIRNWKYPREAAGEQVEVIFEFALNCPKETNEK
jgi:TonB family protein